MCHVPLATLTGFDRWFPFVRANLTVLFLDPNDDALTAAAAAATVAAVPSLL